MTKTKRSRSKSNGSDLDRYADSQAMAEAQVFTLAGAARELGYESERSIRRLIKAKKLDARKAIVSGKRCWVVDRVHLNRYRLIWGGWLERQSSPVPPLEGYEGNLGRVKVFYRYGETVPNPERLKTYSVEVSIQDFWRFCCTPIKSKAEYDSLKAELQSRLPEKQENFQIRFAFDEQAKATLQRIINSVPPLLIPGEGATVLKGLALQHLIMVTLPSLHNAKRGWVSYLRQSVRNFYADKARQSNKLERSLSDLPDSGEVANLLYATSRKKKPLA